MQTKVYFSATIKNCTCANIGTPGYWLLLDDLEKWILLSQVCQEFVEKNMVLQVKEKTSWDLSERVKRKKRQRGM